MRNLLSGSDVASLTAQDSISQVRGSSNPHGKSAIIAIRSAHHGLTLPATWRG